MFLRFARIVVKLSGFFVLVGAALGDYGVRFAWRRRHLDAGGRAVWLHRWTGRALRWLNVKIRVDGTPAPDGMVTSNHLGYLDVFVLSALSPIVFVSRDDVARWPLAGLLTRLAGTIFIDRRNRADVVRVAEAIVPIVSSGQRLAVFLEGTSTGGDRVLPFNPSLLAPAIRQQWTVQPAFLQYTARDARSPDELCYWGEAVFLPHFLRFLALREVQAHVRWGAPLTATGPRHSLAARLHREVSALGGLPPHDLRTAASG